MTFARRRAGLLVPLFSFPSSTSWGIGDIGDVAPMTTWLAGAGQRGLQLLPLNEMAPVQQSPYSAMSAMAIDPIYRRGADMPASDDLAADRADLERVRGGAHVDYPTVRRLKQRALTAAFDRFHDVDLMRDGSDSL